MCRRTFSVILVAGMITFSGSVALADDYHYTNLLIGDRASGMAGAYTAVSDDATGLYYNPAGTAYTMGRSFSASVNAYYSTEKKYKDVIGGNGWVRTSSSLLPNYFGVVQPFGRFKIGISYAVPESIIEDQSQTFHDLQLGAAIRDLPQNAGVTITSYTINFNNESTTYNFGPSIATELSDNISAGFTLYYFQHKNLTILNQIIKTSNDGYELSNLYTHVDEWGLRPILGVMWSPMDKVSIGLAVSKVMLLSSDTSVQQTYERRGIAYAYDTNNDGIADTTLTDEVSLPDGQSSTDEKRKYPTQVSLGVAWFASPSLLVSGDINHYTQVKEQAAEEVNNIAVGAEYYFTRNWAMRGGFFTDFANTPKISSGRINQLEHIDLYGGTVSISRFTRNTSVTLGGGYTYGDGKAQIISDSDSIQNAESQGWMFFLSSSYSY
jgi:long-subunit fatty acid transport protein